MATTVDVIEKKYSWDSLPFGMWVVLKDNTYLFKGSDSSAVVFRGIGSHFDGNYAILTDIDSIRKVIFDGGGIYSIGVGHITIELQ